MLARTFTISDYVSKTPKKIKGILGNLIENTYLNTTIIKQIKTDNINNLQPTFFVFECELNPYR